MAAAHCRQGSSVVVSTRFEWRRNSSLASTFISAWASDEPKISPCGPSESNTRFRAEEMMLPSALEAQAPTAMVPLCRASHA
jgi:hypothetical protein